MEEENKKGKCIKVRGKALTIYIIIIVVVASAISFGSGFILGKKMYEEKKKESPKEIQDKPANNNQVEDKPQNEVTGDGDVKVTEQLFEKLKNIAQLDNESSKTDLFTPLLSHDGLLSSFDTNVKTSIVYQYAKNNGMSNTTNSQTDSNCNSGGSGICIRINKADFDEIAKKYGYTNLIPEVYGPCKIYNNMYYFNYGGDATPYEKTLHNVTYVTNGEDIILTDNLTYKYYDHSHADDTETREFTFKKGADGSYYLYSVYKK